MIVKQRLVTLREAADEVGIPYITAYKRMTARSLGEKYGRDWLLTRRDVELLAEERPAGNPKWVKAGEGEG